jgi:hypothetical protein
MACDRTSGKKEYFKLEKNFEIMHLRKVLLAPIFLGAGVCVGSSPAPFNIELEFVNRIFAATKYQPSQQVALGSLMRVAEGHPEAIDAGVAGRIGLKLETPSWVFFETSRYVLTPFSGLGRLGFSRAWIT